MRVDSAVEKALLGAKAKNLKAARALLELDPAKAEFDDAGNLKGLDEQIKKLKTSEDAGFLFEAEKQAALQMGIIDEFAKSNFLFDRLTFDDRVSPPAAARR